MFFHDAPFAGSTGRGTGSVSRRMRPVVEEHWIMPELAAIAPPMERSAQRRSRFRATRDQLEVRCIDLVSYLNSQYDMRLGTTAEGAEEKGEDPLNAVLLDKEEAGRTR